MSANKYLDHVLIIPEDDANRQLAIGFMNHPCVRFSAVFVSPPAGGWTKVLSRFAEEEVSNLRKTPKRVVVMLFDFDDDVVRRRMQVAESIPLELQDRVIAIGVRSKPEAARGNLRPTLRKYEDIGHALAEECCSGKSSLWKHELLSHNELELLRIDRRIREFLFE